MRCAQRRSTDTAQASWQASPGLLQDCLLAAALWLCICIVGTWCATAKTVSGIVLAPAAPSLKMLQPNITLCQQRHYARQRRHPRPRCEDAPRAGAARCATRHVDDDGFADSSIARTCRHRVSVHRCALCRAPHITENCPTHSNARPRHLKCATPSQTGTKLCKCREEQAKKTHIASVCMLPTYLRNTVS